MAEKPADDAKGVHDEPDKGDSESPEETMARHEELHREHRARLDHHAKFMRAMGMPADDVTGGEHEPDKGDSMRRRRRHD